MTVPAGAVIRPFVHTEPVALMFWVLINFVSFAFEFVQWQERRAEATRSEKGGLGLLLTCAALVMTSTDQPVITSGPYRFVRHPGYTGGDPGRGRGRPDRGELGGPREMDAPRNRASPVSHPHRGERPATALGDRYRAYAAQHKRLVPLIW